MTTALMNRESHPDSALPFQSPTWDSAANWPTTSDYLFKPIRVTELARVFARPEALIPRQAEVTILIVDDEPGLLNLYSRMVRAYAPNWRVMQTTEGHRAVEIVRNTRPDLVLLDLLMPGLDGFAVLEAMQQTETTRDIPVILLTGYTLTERDLSRLNPGVVKVLAKGVFSAAEIITHMEEAALSRKRWAGGEARGLVRKAVMHLQAHYAEPFSREGLARQVGVSEDYLTYCFRQETGLTPLAYLNRYRINLAKALLLGSDKTITAIAVAVGFSDAHHFGRAFRREAGMSPSAYRRESPFDSDSTQKVTS